MRLQRPAPELSRSLQAASWESSHEFCKDREMGQGTCQSWRNRSCSQATPRCLHGDKLTIPDTPPQESLGQDTLGDSWDLLPPGTRELQQLLSQSWAVWDCPSQCFILIAVGGMGMGSAIKEIPASHLNLAKLSWRSNLGELIVCGEKVCLLALSKEISFCLIKPPMSLKDK